MKKVTIIGAGLAGCEAAWQLANRGIKVDLIEMKPLKHSPAHSMDGLCELVCSNSLKSNDVTSACGLLKQELRLLDSLVIGCADMCSVAAGSALAVDRDKLSQLVTEKIKAHNNITLISEVCNRIPQGKVVIATGPLTDDGFIDSIKDLCGDEFLHFFDAASPIVTRESIDFNSAYIASRYNKGTPDYINCPMDKQEFEYFWQQLVDGKTAQIKDFEKDNIFESCIPIEIMAQRGQDTMRFGPLKPVGLYDDRKPEGQRKAYAVLQLRKENNAETLYNLVGFQTHLTFSEQKRIFSLIPALKNAEFVRYGVMHRNTYINSPNLLNEYFRLKTNANIYFAGQITGVEGYVESIASGCLAAINAYCDLVGKSNVSFTDMTMMGALASYISSYNGGNFQPMNANFAIIKQLNKDVKDKQQRKQMYAERSLEIIKNIQVEYKGD